jgi:hypothetical protein
MYLSTVFYRKKDLYTISDIEIFIFYLNLMTLSFGSLFIATYKGGPMARDVTAKG